MEDDLLPILGNFLGGGEGNGDSDNERDTNSDIGLHY